MGKEQYPTTTRSDAHIRHCALILLLRDRALMNNKTMAHPRCRSVGAAAKALYFLLHVPPKLSRRTHRSQDCRTPQEHVRRALELFLMASRQTWLTVTEQTHREGALSTTKDDFIVSHERAFVQRDPFVQRDRCFSVHLA